MVIDLLKQKLAAEKGLYIKEKTMLRLKFLQDNVNKETSEKFFRGVQDKEICGRKWYLGFDYFSLCGLDNSLRL